jgi:hypothetical protein
VGEYRVTGACVGPTEREWEKLTGFNLVTHRLKTDRRTRMKQPMWHTFKVLQLNCTHLKCSVLQRQGLQLGQKTSRLHGSIWGAGYINKEKSVPPLSCRRQGGGS